MEQAFGHYRIVEELGSGGMGTVYRATDTRLNRDAALKILTGPLARDPDRMARFEREAQVLAWLNHPCIASIYGLEEDHDKRALAMELVEGKTLAERMAAGPVPIEEAAAIAEQIAEALEYAHDKGIVHRDLKPANVKITPEGTVKVLDFGLAKAAEPLPESGDPAKSPTITHPISQAGLIMGTAAYMSPEQASGRVVDKRSDIWSFGVLLWELITGKRLFQGETVAHTLADILRQPLELGKLKHVPPPIRNLLARCLDRNVRTRLRDIGEARIILNEYLSRPAAGTDRARARRVGAMLLTVFPWVALLAVLGGALALWPRREPAASPRPSRFLISHPPGTTVRPQDMPIISPDGRYLAFTAVQPGGDAVLWLRPMDSVEARPLAGTEKAYFPFWSPDSRSVAFFSGSRLKKIDIAGGAPTTLCENLMAVGAGGTWSHESGIVVGIDSGPLQQITDEGSAVPIRALDTARSEMAQIWPRFLPDGKQLLYVSRSNKLGASGIYAAAMGSGAAKLVMNADTVPWYAPSGHLLFTRNETLLAQPFDARTLQLSGEPAFVAEGVGRILEAHGALYSVSQNGTIVYRSSSARGQRVGIYDRNGLFIDVAGEPGTIRQLTLSDDQQRLVMERLDPKTRTWDLWLFELNGGILSRLTFDPLNESDPVWAPDSRQVIFNSDRNGAFDLYRKDIGSAEEQLVLQSPGKKVPEDWLPDNSVIFAGQGGRDYYWLPLAGKPIPVQVLKSEFTVDEVHVSPDQKLVAYGSIESGRWEVYVASYPKFADKRQISGNGGNQPQWRGDGREICYLSPEGKMMAVEIRRGDHIEAGPPRALFDTRLKPSATMDQYALSADGNRFFLVEPLVEGDQPITVILNWADAR